MHLYVGFNKPSRGPNFSVANQQIQLLHIALCSLSVFWKTVSVGCTKRLRSRRAQNRRAESYSGRTLERGGRAQRSIWAFFSSLLEKPLYDQQLPLSTMLDSMGEI